MRAAAFDCGVALLNCCEPRRRATHLEPALRRTVYACLAALDASNFKTDAAPPQASIMSMRMSSMRMSTRMK